MSFIMGLIAGSMLSNQNSKTLVSRTWEEERQIFFTKLYFIIFTFALTFVMYYIVCICMKRDILKDAMDATNNISSGGFEAWLWIKKLPKEEKENLRKKNKIQTAMNTLQEKPKFFLSPLWIAKFTLRKEINVKLQELQKELTELQCQTF
jgi:hypothetical protein